MIPQKGIENTQPPTHLLCAKIEDDYCVNKILFLQSLLVVIAMISGWIDGWIDRYPDRKIAGSVRDKARKLGSQATCAEC